MSDEQISHFWLKLHRLEDQIRTEATWEGHQLYRTLYGYKSRVERLQAAMAASLPLARQLIAAKLAGLDLTMVWSILAAVLHDVALYYCGSALLGTAIGAGAGAMAGGVGAVPGAAIGLAAGMQLGTWLMTFLGLKMFAEGLSETVPQAFRCYWDGAQAAWGPATRDRFDARYPTNPASSEREAEYRFAHGHELMIVGLLIAIVFYFTHGGGDDEALLKAIRASRRLGPKMADWVAKNKDILKNHPALQPRVRLPAVQQELPETTRRARGPSRLRASGGATANVPNAGADAAAGGASNAGSVWNLSPIERGDAIESSLANTEYSEANGWFHVGELNEGYFPLVDFQQGNTLVSLKTVDTSGSTWMGRMESTIDDLANNGATVNGQPANMVLDIRVQPGGAQDAAPLIQYGQQQGVTVIVKEFP